MPDSVSSHTAYFGHYRDDEKRILSRFDAITRGQKFDTVVGTGLSGALVVPVIGRALNLHWALARKPSDQAHSTKLLEGTVGRRWLFVDDLIDSGITLNRVKAAVSAVVDQHNTREQARHDFNKEWYAKEPAKQRPLDLFSTSFVGAYLYEDPEFIEAGGIGGFDNVVI